jgi:hypothetical protein
VLERAGLIVRSRRAQYRPCALEPSAFAAISSWADHYRPIWDARFDRMESSLRDHDGERRDGGSEEDHG